MKTMRIEFKDLSEGQVNAITEVLEGMGFEYEVDYECLYGAKWMITGLQVANTKVAAAVLDVIAELA